jgi:hypothetical protein
MQDEPTISLPTREERRACRSVVNSVKSWPKTYQLRLNLACGHAHFLTITAQKFNAGERGPKSVQCGECAAEMAKERKVQRDG